MASPRFIHLRVHSDYSMIDGLAKTGPLVKKSPPWACLHWPSRILLTLWVSEILWCGSWCGYQANHWG